MPQAREVKKILIIDDNAAVRSTLDALLRESGYSTITAENGLDGLYKAKQENPDLVLLDVMLPGMDGYRVCRIIKMSSNLKNIPVVMLTSRMSDEDKAKGFESGADGYLVKATRVEIILDEIKKQLERK
jgi:two-component system, OmpR family, alkaline phosphatase synthesis response regulator PhoP